MPLGAWQTHHPGRCRHQQGGGKPLVAVLPRPRPCRPSANPAPAALLAGEAFGMASCCWPRPSRPPGADRRRERAAKGVRQVAQRAAQTLPIAKAQNWLLDIALDHLTLARCALYADLLHRHARAGRPAHTEAAVAGLRQAGTMDHLPVASSPRLAAPPATTSPVRKPTSPKPSASPSAAA